MRRILPDRVIKEIAAQHGGDQRERKLPVVVHVWLLIMLVMDPGIRSLDMLIQRVWRRVAGEGDPVDKSALSRKNSTQAPEIFRDLLTWLVTAYEERFGTKARLTKLAWQVMAMDSTVIDIAGRLHRWFYSNGRKSVRSAAQAKLHVLYNADLGLPVGTAISRGSSHDVSWARKLLRKLTGPTLMLFDRGYWDHGLFTWLIDKHHAFVTRLKKVAKYRIIKKLGNGDWLVRFDRSKRTTIPHVLRLVRRKTLSGEVIYFVTSLTDADSFTVAHIAAFYVRRWQIETFFRELKHVLKLHRVHSMTVGGIRCEIYAALCAYVLVKYLRAEAALKLEAPIEDLSFKRTLDILKVWLGDDINRLYQASPAQTRLQWDDLIDYIGYYAGDTGRSKKKPVVSKAGHRKSKRVA
jgi:putative transposase